MNQVALITGASRGIGKACALRLAEDNMKIVVNYNKSEAKALEVVAQIKAFGKDAIAVKADVANPNEVEALFKATVDHYGRLDVLINNSGIVEDSYLMVLNEASLDRCIDINLKGYFYCCKQAALMMFKRKSGKIVNISSVSSMRAVAGQTVYSATKGAINAMTKTLAKELSPLGIQVNAVAPGFIMTEIVSGLPEERKKEYLRYIPMQRFGETQEVAEVVGFLCSGKASYLTGQIIVVDGGLSI